VSFLYRGVSHELHANNCGLLPKATDSFEYSAKWDEAKWDSGETWDRSVSNAVIRHQRDQKDVRTSGISTTPHIRRAEHYATHGGKRLSGIVYRIDRGMLAEFGVSELVVKDHATHPHIPEDDEVILVSANFGALPGGIVVEIIDFRREAQ
jgi:hypothetical protein